MLKKIKQKLSGFSLIASRRYFLGAFVLIITALCIAASLSSVNTYYIHEGDAVRTFNSTVETCSDALIEAGITAGENDLIEMPEAPSNKAAHIYVYRGKSVSVNDGGTVKLLNATKEKTLSELFAGNNLSLSETDVCSLPLDTEISDGLSVEVTRISTETVTENQEIAFKTERRASAALYKGNEKVVQKGVKGAKTATYSVTTKNGNVIEKKLMSETVTKQPVNKIVEYGTKQKDTSGTLKLKDGTTIKYKKVLDMTATAYTTERWTKKTTATGQIARVGLVAVDPKVIPLGTKLYIVSADGKSWSYGTAVAADTGVRGNKIDLFYNTYNECISFGRRKAKVYIL